MPKYFDDFSLPLVDAIRATKLLTPICGRGPNATNGRPAVVVMATPVDPYVSAHIEVLIERVLRDYVDADLHGEIDIDIVKRYIPPTSLRPLEYSYNIHVTAIDDDADEVTRLRALKKALLLTIKSIRKHS